MAGSATKQFEIVLSFKFSLFIQFIQSWKQREFVYLGRKKNQWRSFFLFSLTCLHLKLQSAPLMPFSSPALPCYNMSRRLLLKRPIVLLRHNTQTNMKFSLWRDTSSRSAGSCWPCPWLILGHCHWKDKLLTSTSDLIVWIVFQAKKCQIIDGLRESQLFFLVLRHNWLNIFGFLDAHTFLGKES